MGDFSPEWLRLREPADHRSRNAALARDVAFHFADRKSIRVVDLGAGLGSNLRALAPQLPVSQEWHLLDSDAALLGAAREELDRWRLRLSDLQPRIAFSTKVIDIAHDIESIFDGSPDLITAAALFDLVSESWIERLVEAIARHGVAFYATLTYDGGDCGNPSHPLDTTMISALHVHQHRDKGFGPAAGPKAVSILREAFKARKFDVRTASSPWRLDANDAAILTMLGDGVASAVAETGLVSPADIAAWKDFHMPGSRWHDIAWIVGHTDMLAVP
jgi:hypothetical protein